MTEYNTYVGLSDQRAEATSATVDGGTPSDEDACRPSVMAEDKHVPSVVVDQPEATHPEYDKASNNLTSPPARHVDKDDKGNGERSGEKTKHDKSSIFQGGLLLSTFYCLLAIILGIALPTNDALQDRWLEDKVSAAYQVYMYAVGFLFLAVLEIYLTMFEKCRRKLKAGDAEKDDAKPNPEAGYVNVAFESDDKCSRVHHGPLAAQHPRLSNRSSVLSEVSIFEEGDKMASAGRVVENRTETTLYIRIVFIILGLAVMVYDGLLIKQLQEGLSPSACGRNIIYWPQYIHMGFLLMQSYFLFKHSKLKIFQSKLILRMGFVHVMATNVNEMTRAFISETHNGYLSYRSNQSLSVVLNAKEARECNSDGEDIMERAAPYLYPCVVEYNFLAAALMYCMYSSLGCDDVYCVQHSSEVVSPIEVNCKRTHKGLFLGTVILAGTIVSVILFFSYLRTSGSGVLSLLLYQISDIALHSVLILTVMVAWIQTRRLKSLSPIYLALEDGVLLISMSLGVLFNVFFLLPVVTTLNEGNNDNPLTLSLAGSLVAIAAGVVQTSFMIDLSCRSLTTESEWDRKPGRGSIIFLLLTNLAIWLLETFRIRALQLHLDIQVDAYGYLPWRIIVYLLVPHVVFYYLFSSACLARTWHRTYTENNVGINLATEQSPRYENCSKPANEVEFIRQRKINRALKLDVHSISPISDV